MHHDSNLIIRGVFLVGGGGGGSQQKPRWGQASLGPTFYQGRPVHRPGYASDHNIRDVKLTDTCFVNNCVTKL